MYSFSYLLLVIYMHVFFCSCCKNKHYYLFYNYLFYSYLFYSVSIIIHFIVDIYLHFSTTVQ